MGPPKQGSRPGRPLAAAQQQRNAPSMQHPPHTHTPGRACRTLERTLLAPAAAAAFAPGAARSDATGSSGLSGTPKLPPPSLRSSRPPSMNLRAACQARGGGAVSRARVAGGNTPPPFCPAPTVGCELRGETQGRWCIPGGSVTMDAGHPAPPLPAAAPRAAARAPGHGAGLPVDGVGMEVAVDRCGGAQQVCIVRRREGERALRRGALGGGQHDGAGLRGGRAIEEAEACRRERGGQEEEPGWGGTGPRRGQPGGPQAVWRRRPAGPCAARGPRPRDSPSSSNGSALGSLGSERSWGMG